MKIPEPKFERGQRVTRTVFDGFRAYKEYYYIHSVHINLPCQKQSEDDNFEYKCCRCCNGNTYWFQERELEDYE